MGLYYKVGNDIMSSSDAVLFTLPLKESCNSWRKAVITELLN